MRTFLIGLIVLLSMAFGQNYSKPFQMQIQKKFPQGTIYDVNDKCEFSWKILDSKGEEIPLSFLYTSYKHVQITINEIIYGQETQRKQEKIPISNQVYHWETPLRYATTKYWIIFEAIPRDGEKIKKLSNRISIYVREFKKTNFVPNSFRNCLRFLMDWNGKRGYYRHLSPTKAWRMAQNCCKWIRKNMEKGYYRDYLAFIEKMERSRLEEFIVYCPVKNARLTIDGWLSGFFQQKDPERDMYFLKVLLPVSRSYSYKFKVHKGKYRYQNFHTHISKSEVVVRKLHKVVYISLVTPFLSRVAIEGKNFSKEHKKHVLEIYTKKIQTILISSKKHPDLKIVLYPKKAITVKIKKEKGNFVLYYNGKRYNFLGNEVKLMDF